MSLLLRQIRLRLGGFTLELDAEIRSRVTGIVGPSGSGKTTLLDLVAGLLRPQSALVQLGDRILTDSHRGVFVPVRRRRIGYVPQDLALFPHLSVRQNLLYGCRGSLEGQHLFSLGHIVETLDIATLLDRAVPGLSGGEKQRVALGRALLSAPQLLLLDEPLANLDPTLKTRILPYLARVRDEFGLPMLYVSHDETEVASLCEEVLRLNSGRLDPNPSP